MQAARPTSAPAAQPVLKVAGVCKSFGGITLPLRAGPSVPVLQDVSFEVSAGEIMVLRGANGSGKTTLLKIVAGLVLPDRGKVQVDGGGGRGSGKAAIGFSSGEERSLYWRLTARQNLEFFGALYGLTPGDSRQRAAALLEALGLEDRADRPVRQFSAGQKQRVLVGRALMPHAQLVLLDEPLARMDEATAALVWEVLERHADMGAALVIATHRPDDEAHADIVAHLADHQLQVSRPHSGPPGAALPASLPPAADRGPRPSAGTMRSSFRRARGFFARDFAQARSYPFGLVSQLVGAVAGSALVFFLSQVVGSESHYLRAYGGDYFGFAVLGLVAFTLQFGLMNSFAATVRGGQISGSLEALLATPASLAQILVCSSLWSTALAALSTVSLLVTSIVVFGLRFDGALSFLALPIVAVGLICAAGVGLCEAAFVLVIKRGSPVNLVMTHATNLLGGVFYPIAVLPPVLQLVALLLPVTHSANALRLAMLAHDGPAALRDIAALALLSAVYTAVGLVGLRLALTAGRKQGALGQY